MKYLGVGLFVFFLGGGALIAEVPPVIHYQGRLVDGTGLVNRTVGLELKLFDGPGGVDVLYADSSTVQVVDGLYSTFIGDNTVSGELVSVLSSGSNVYLEAVVDGIPLAPRERISSVAFAMKSGNSDFLGGQAAAVYATGTPLYVESDPVYQADNPEPSPTPYKIYLRFISPSIDGGSTNSGHSGWIDVYDYSHAVYGGAQSDTPYLSISKGLDRASPALFEKCLTGQIMSEAEIEFESVFGTSGVRRVFHKITLNNVLIDSSVKLPSQPYAETITLFYEEIEWRWNQIDPVTGAQTNSYSETWNLATQS